MTRRTVVWVPSAERELADIWLSAPLRDHVTAAVNAIDSALSDDAELFGSPLTEGLYAINELPLRVLFEILDEDRLVRVLMVKETR